MLEDSNKISTLEGVSDRDKKALIVGFGVFGFLVALTVFSLFLLLK